VAEGAAPSPKASTTAMHPMTAEMVASVQMARCGGEVGGVETAEVAADFLVLAHGVGDTGSGVDAGEGGADERQEDGEGLAEHEGAAMALAEERVANNHHHVSDGRSGGACGGHGVAAIEEVVCGEVLKAVKDRSLQQK